MPKILRTSLIWSSVDGVWTGQAFICVRRLSSRESSLRFFYVWFLDWPSVPIRLLSIKEGRLSFPKSSNERTSFRVEQKMKLLGGITTLILLAFSRNCDAKAREDVKIKGSTQPPCWSRRSGECESKIFITGESPIKSELREPASKSKREIPNFQLGETDSRHPICGFHHMLWDHEI